MVRLPADRPPGQTLADSMRRGRDFTAALQRDQTNELKMFLANLHAAAKYGPVKGKPTPPAPPPPLLWRHFARRMTGR